MISRPQSLENEHTIQPLSAFCDSVMPDGQQIRTNSYNNHLQLDSNNSEHLTVLNQQTTEGMKIIKTAVKHWDIHFKPVFQPHLLISHWLNQSRGQAPNQQGREMFFPQKKSASKLLGNVSVHRQE